ncbi:MAG: alpha/beta hydrolase [Spirochaetia bacterium]|nr:alpha/beta hydrolase [Spirochaetia bacterium]
MPGLGGDERMYAPILLHLPQQLRSRTKVVKLTAPAPRETLPQYAERILTEQNFIGRDYAAVAGVSFGGMLTQESIRQGFVRADRAVLLSTAFTGSDVTLLGRLSGALLGIVPPFLRSLVVRGIALFYPLFRWGMPEARVFARMLIEQERDLYFRVPRMIHNWRPENPGRLPVPFEHMQGTSDPLISYSSLSRVRIPEIPLYGGNHLVFVSHADIAARLIARAVTP